MASTENSNPKQPSKSKAKVKTTKKTKVAKAPSTKAATKKVTSNQIKTKEKEPVLIDEQPSLEAVETPSLAESVAGASGAKTDKKINKRLWGLVLIIAIIGLVAFESFWILKEKIAQQASLQRGQIIGQRGGPPEEVGEFWGPGKIIVDKSNNRICMLDVNYWKACFWNIADGSHIIDLDKYGKHKVGFEKNKERLKDFRPADGAFDGTGNLYILDIIHSEVTVVSPKYEILGNWKTSPARSITADQAGNIYIIDATSKQVIKYNAQGQELSRFGKGRLFNPGFMAADEQGNIYVVEKGSKKVVVFNSKGKLKTSWKLKTFDPIGNPDIDVVKDKVYLCEHDNQSIAVYTLEGKLLQNMKAAYPAVIGVDANETIYISEGAGIAGYTIEKKF